MIDRNLWIKQNLAMLRSAVDITGLVMSPGAKGGLSSDDHNHPRSCPANLRRH